MSEVSGNDLPAGWVTAPLGVVAGESVEQFGANGRETFLYIDIGSIDSQSKRISVPKQLSAAVAPSRARQNLKKGDVIISMTRPNLNAVALVGDEFDGAVGSTAFHVLRTKHVEPSWLYRFVQTREFVGAMCALVQGALYPAIRPRDIQECNCPIPPRAEQARVADALDELLSELDAGIAGLLRVQTHLKRYRDAVLKAAVEGSLTANWREQHPDVEPASELLHRILAERRRRWEEDQLTKFKAAGKEPSRNWKEKYPAPVPPEPVGLPVLPRGWAVASMDSVTSRITSGSRDWQKYYGRGSGTFIMAQNVRPGRLDMSFRQQVDPPASDSSCERSMVFEDDLLVTIVGANTGDVCRVHEPVSEHYVCQSVALMRPVQAVTARFLNVYYNSLGGGQLHFQRYLYGAGRPHLSFDQLKMTPVFLPPIEEQEAIVEVVEDQLSVIDHLEADLGIRLKSAQSLHQSILRSAFSGQLVEQDPHDEPADVLLKRIITEREGRTRSAAVVKQAVRAKLPARVRPARKRASA